MTLPLLSLESALDLAERGAAWRQWGAKRESVRTAVIDETAKVHAAIEGLVEAQRA